MIIYFYSFDFAQKDKLNNFSSLSEVKRWIIFMRNQNKQSYPKLLKTLYINNKRIFEKKFANEPNEPS